MNYTKKNMTFKIILINIKKSKYFKTNLLFQLFKEQSYEILV